MTWRNTTSTQFLFSLCLFAFYLLPSPQNLLEAKENFKREKWKEKNDAQGRPTASNQGWRENIAVWVVEAASRAPTQLICTPYSISMYMSGMCSTLQQVTLPQRKTVSDSLFCGGFLSRIHKMHSCFPDLAFISLLFCYWMIVIYGLA